MKREKEVEALKLIIAENMAKYSKAGMPYDEALKMCALGILASGFGKVDELNDEIAGLTGKVEALNRTMRTFGALSRSHPILFPKPSRKRQKRF